MLAKICSSFFIFFLTFFCGTELQAYSMLSHQAMIDAVWDKDLVPVLEKKFPGATPAQLKEAHAYAYGGAIMPDMGYYPLGSRFFTDLVHYVRTGDFIQNLILEAQNRNELAFALGALAHYFGDIHGHKLATNRSVPLVYPKTRKRFGEVVIYEQDPVAHMRMEFGFDVLQAARKNYAPQVYRDFIGFKISREVLERAFFKTYGLKLRQTFVFSHIADRIFRLSVKAVLPQLTKIGWQWVDEEAMKNQGSSADRKVAHLLRRSSFNEMFEGNNDEPGVSARIIAATLRFVPKIGLLKPLNFEIPTPEAESLFAISFETAVQDYQSAIRKFPNSVPVLSDFDLDTGYEAHLGETDLADQTFARLLQKLADEDFETASEALKADGLQYFAAMPPPPDYRKEKKQWRKTKASLQKLQESRPGKDAD